MRGNQAISQSVSIAIVVLVGSTLISACSAQQDLRDDPFTPPVEEKESFIPGDSPIALFFEGNRLEAAGEHQEATAVYKRLIEIDPEAWDGHARLAKLLFHEKLFEESIVHGMAALRRWQRQPVDP